MDISRVSGGHRLRLDGQVGTEAVPGAGATGGDGQLGNTGMCVR